MKKKRIVIASVLKPVDDTRMFDKMAMTLQRSGTYEIYIVGAFAASPKSTPGVTLAPLNPFSRLSLARLIAPLKVLRKVAKWKPEVLIVNTHELLLVSVLIRIFFGTIIIYDIRENYFLNIRHTNAFPPVIRELLAFGVRLKEVLTSSLFHTFFLAEAGYKNELKFLPDRAIILENKSAGFPSKQRDNDKRNIRLAFTGTLAESTGVFEAIELARKLHAVDTALHLHIIGFAVQYSAHQKILAAISNTSFVTLTGGNQLVPHSEIAAAIASADFGIIYYPSAPNNESSVPTKLYEYLSAGLPILLQPRPHWVALCAPSNAAIPVDFHNIDAHELIRKMKTETFYTRAAENVTWEGDLFINALQHLTD